MQNDALVKDLAAGGSAETLLATMFKHYPALCAPVPIEETARSAGISEFREQDIGGFTSGLMTGSGGTNGIILFSTSLSTQRRRFAIAHQLGHFLLKEQGSDRHCTSSDLIEYRRDSPRRKEETQANRFAAGLLMPKPLFAAFVAGLGKPTVAHLPTIAAAYEVSLEAAASRYVDLSQSACALLLIRQGIVRYARPSRSFPPLSIQLGDPAPAEVPLAGRGDKIAWVSAEARDWLVMSRDIRPPKLTLQSVGREDGLKLVMLSINTIAERRADEEAEKLAMARPKFGR